MVLGYAAVDGCKSKIRDLRLLFGIKSFARNRRFLSLES